MSSFITSKTDTNSKPSSPISSHRVDENTVRQSMHKLSVHDNLNDPSSPGDDDDVRSPLSSPRSFKNDHAKFTSNSDLFSLYLRDSLFIGELLLEWITLNSDSRNSNTQDLIQDVKSGLHPNSNNNSNANDFYKVN